MCAVFQLICQHLPKRGDTKGLGGFRIMSDCGLGQVAFGCGGDFVDAFSLLLLLLFWLYKLLLSRAYKVERCSPSP